MKALFLAAPILGIAAACAGIAGCRSAGGPPQVSEPSQTDAIPHMMLIEMAPPFRMVTLTVNEWRKLGSDGAGHYKNPDTQQFTMALPMRCASCEEFIPPPPIPRSVAALPPAERDAEVARIQRAYQCPKCGKSPYFSEAPRKAPPPAPRGPAGG